MGQVFTIVYSGTHNYYQKKRHFKNLNNEVYNLTTVVASENGYIDCSS